MTAHGVAASVRARLLNRANAEGRPFQELLEYFAMERFLYRLSCSPQRRVLRAQGRLMLQLWHAERARSTRDIDLLGLVTPSADEVGRVMRDVLAQAVEDDGVVFDIDGVVAEVIRTRSRYDGVRVRFEARVGAARVAMQIDVGFGDVVTPVPVHIEYPGLLTFDRPKLRAYTPVTTIAEKLEAMVVLGLTNSRMKDYYDLWHLARSRDFDAPLLAQAIRATFERRSTALPTSVPIGLSAELFDRQDKQRQWSAWLRRARLHADAPSLPEVCGLVGGFVAPVLEGMSGTDLDATRWPAGGPWQR